MKTAGKSGGYVTASGTSFSVPFVTAAAALMLGIDPLLTPEDIASILAETARDAGAAGWDEYYGYDILDLGACAGRLGGAADPGTHETPCEFISAFTLVNDTDEDIDCTYLLAEYDGDGTCPSARKTQLTFPAGERTPWRPVYETEAMQPWRIQKNY